MSDKTKTSGPRVFVYGTLKTGHGNHGALKNAEFLGRFKLPGNYVMLDIGYYPGVVEFPQGPKGQVVGEVYQVDEETLGTLDLIEGHPRYYERKKIDTPWKKAWCYFLPQGHLDRGLSSIPDGMWEPTEAEEEWANAEGS